MEEEFYSVIKLITGEEIFSLVSIDQNGDDPLLILQNPVIMKMTKSFNGFTLKIKPWMQIPDDDFFIIKLDKIITMTEIKDESMIELYNNYLEEDMDTGVSLMESASSTVTGKTEVTKGMGYISTVEDARKILERIYNSKDLKDS